jgi:hypothetical protein
MAQYSSDGCQDVPPASIRRHDKLPAIIEIRRSDTKTLSLPSSLSTSLYLLKFLFICLITTIRAMEKYFVRNTHSSINRSDIAIDTISSTKRLYEVIHSSDYQNESNDHDDNSDKRIFRQEMNTLHSLIHLENSSKNKCGGNQIWTDKSNYNNNKICRFGEQNYCIANQMIQQHFVHASYLEKKNNTNRNNISL